MICGIFHKGSGLGDQLFRYITVRTLALDKGFEFGMVCPENFKGKDFMELDMGKKVDAYISISEPNGKVNIEISSLKRWNETTNYYDPEINFIGDNTIIDGNFQDERYWGHRLDFIKYWLQTPVKETEKLQQPDDLCVINFRGGEYSQVPELFLPKEYWDKAIDLIKNKYTNITFEVHTDDQKLAKQFFPDLECISNIGVNWKTVRYAKHLILSNSAFGILPALLNENIKEVIAPRYWARRNKGYWHLPQNYYKHFTYI